ncbi:hypothetical protein [Flavobacterium sp. 3HN19-14]|uniref:hypothetical protein n=1 Tax=Flavobacterium sp. 3HN19-14 TaxID=3448133 RepID=UPI003EE1256A
MEEINQRYLRGQIQALQLIERHLKRRVQLEDLNPTIYFDLILWDAEDEATQAIENDIVSHSLFPELDWTAQALQWLSEDLTPDYESFLSQKNDLDNLRSKLIYSDEEVKAMKFLNNSI